VKWITTLCPTGRRIFSFSSELLVISWLRTFTGMDYGSIRTPKFQTAALSHLLLQWISCKISDNTEVIGDRRVSKTKKKKDRKFEARKLCAVCATIVLSALLLCGDAPASGKPGSRSVASGKGLFMHPNLSVVLPAGWTIEKAPMHMGENIITRFRSDRLSASINVYCYGEAEHTEGTIRKEAMHILGLGYPLRKRLLRKPGSIKTENGRIAMVEVWQGVFEAAGDEYLMRSPLAIMKTRDCWLLMIGYAGEATGPELEEDFLKILRSAQ
jgi:hypothetical protein